jgi:hypothetical protein
VFSYLGGEHLITEFVTGLDLTPLQFLLLAQFIIFLLGWPLEWSEIIIIFVPIFLPLLPHFGIDPLFFGILVALNLQTSFLTPPMAMSAYYLKGIAPPHIQLVQIFKGCLPFLALVFVAMIVLYNFPASCSICRKCSTGVETMLRLPDPAGLAAVARERLARGELRPAEYIEACLKRIDERESEIHAWRTSTATWWPSRSKPSSGARRAGRSVRCTDCRSGSRTSSTPAICPPRTARRSTPGGGPRRDATIVAACGPPGRSSWARRSPPSLPITRRAKPPIRTIRRTPPAAHRPARPRRWRPTWCRSPSAPRPTAR